VGSTEISSKLDPEEWREALAGYHRAAAEEITRFGGHVAKYLGDGVMALFGYPEAHENDAECAVRAALTILDAVGKLDAPVKLSARVGIDSGPVVVGAGASKDTDVFGDAPNIAARVQAVAEPGTVMITEATQRLVSGLFVVEERAAEPFKGIERRVRLYRVAGSSGVRGRLQAEAVVRGMTSFVGREDELRTLMNRWERVREGEGQVVTIVGEAGIGKSRLVRQFREQIASDSHTWLECATAPFFQNTPFYAVAEMLEQSLQWEHRFAALEASLKGLGSSAGAAPKVAPDAANRSASGLSPEEERKRLLARLVEWALKTARNQPLVLVIEDLHWADPSTLELIQLLVEQGATTRQLLLYTARPEFHPPWPLRAHHTQLTLNRLSVREVHAMVGQVAARKALPDETVATVVERTGGVPLFVEELTRAVLDSGDGKLVGRAIPVTLHDSLMARLDRLGAAKETAQIGAVIGNEFSHELLRGVHPIAQADLEGRLRALVDAELIYVRGIAPNATYQFKHALIRDAAYEALLKSRRKELHLRVAQVIEGQFPSIKESQPEVLARHWTEAGENELAVTQWEAAAERAFERGALIEAERQYRQGVTLVEKLPATTEYDFRELKLQMGWARTVSAVKGWSDPESVRAYQRAQELCEKLGKLPELATILNGLSASAFTRGEMKLSLEIAERALDLADRSDHDALRCAAHRRIGESLLFQGHFEAARAHLELSSAFFMEADAQRLATVGAIVPSAITALTYLLLGFPDRARLLFEETVTSAEARGNPYELAFARMYGCVGFLAIRDAHALRHYAKELKLVSQKVPFFVGHADVYMGMASQMLAANDFEELINRGIAFWRATDFRLTRPFELRFEAELARSRGRIAEALTLLESAGRKVEEARWLQPSILTLQAELLAQGEASAAVIERIYREAVESARAQGGKLFELETTTSFALWLRSQGRRDEARTMLAEIYNWFTEGFDTADLKDAKALLDELSNSP
jgi:class 3 adenylate cyclase/tetratricopeptide (TPR) repeat protein